MDSEKVKQLQSALAQAGYDPGPIDGKLGSRTREALKKAQKDKGLSATGQIDQETMAALGMGESGQPAEKSGG
jgi:peptidoglycan hydrolase-like protein with peptidoglycan-binding domain